MITNPYIKDFAQEPLTKVKSYPIYFINGSKFYTSFHGSHKATSNNGVYMRGTSYFEFKDDYYGELNENFQLECNMPPKHTTEVGS